jgi:hypothetical protein
MASAPDVRVSTPSSPYVMFLGWGHASNWTKVHYGCAGRRSTRPALGHRLLSWREGDSPHVDQQEGITTTYVAGARRCEQAGGGRRGRAPEGHEQCGEPDPERQAVREVAHTSYPGSHPGAGTAESGEARLAVSQALWMAESIQKLRPAARVNVQNSSISLGIVREPRMRPSVTASTV